MSSPDAQRLAIEQKRVELNVKEDGNITITKTRKRKPKLSKEDIAVIDKRLKQIEKLADTAISTMSYVEKVSEHITGRFELNKYELLTDLLKPDGTPKYKDISQMYLYGFAGWLLPSRFMKTHPALQFTAQKIGDFMNKIDREMEFFLYNLQAKKLKFGDELDSLSLISIVSDMTKVLRIEIYANEISKIKNIQDIINISKKKD